MVDGSLGRGGGIAARAAGAVGHGNDEAGGEWLKAYAVVTVALGADCDGG